MFRHDQALCQVHAPGMPSGCRLLPSPVARPGTSLPQRAADLEKHFGRSWGCSASHRAREHLQLDGLHWSRRQAASMAVLWSLSCLAPAQARADRGLQRYIKKRQLDLLETYVPAVLSARDQLQEVGDLMGVDPAQARYLLRHGAFDTVRDSVKAIGEYAATEDMSQSEAEGLVDTVFRRLQDLDFVFFSAQKRGKQPDLSQAEAKLLGASKAINKLLATVPRPVLEKGEAIAKAVQRGQVDSMSKGAPQPAASLADRLKDLVPQS